MITLFLHETQVITHPIANALHQFISHIKNQIDFLGIGKRWIGEDRNILPNFFPTKTKGKTFKNQKIFIYFLNKKNSKTKGKTFRNSKKVLDNQKVRPS